uniref:Evasin n=1 Tax=Amblyomma triste TaxID=251400 RepID=A0A023G4E4_AMBTT
MSSSMFQLFLFVCALQATMPAYGDSPSCKPKKVLLQTNGQTIPVGCVYRCETENEKVMLSENGERCVDITLHEARKMPPRLEHRCPTGLCNEGTCKRDDLQVLCWYTGNDDASIPRRA